MLKLKRSNARTKARVDVPTAPEAPIQLRVALPLALAFGGCLTISLAPAYAWWFAPLCLCGLFMLLNQQRTVRSALIGLTFGLGWFGVGFWWMYRGLVNYADTPPSISLILAVCLIVLLALYPAVCSALQSRLRAGRSAQPKLCVRTEWLVIAAIWTISEWIRSNIFIGIPLLSLGYTQTGGPLSGIGPIAGVEGQAFVLIAIAAGLHHVLTSYQYHGFGQVRTLVLTIVGVLTVVLTAQSARSIEWTHSEGKPLEVRLLQGNLSQHEKFGSKGLATAITMYTEMMRFTTAKLVVMPETALPVEWHRLPKDVVSGLRRIAIDRNATLVMGGVVGDTSNKETKERFFNSVLALRPQESEASYDYRYDKHILIPVGEDNGRTLPWLHRALNLRFSSFSPGSSTPESLTVDDAHIAFGICFESLFDAATAEKAKSANLLINVSNFAWFDNTYASAQHFQAAQQRSIETGRWTLQGSNTGITGAIDQHGHIRETLEPQVSEVLDVSAELRTGDTPFMKFGNVPLLLACFLIMITQVVQLYRRVRIKARS